MAFEVDIGISRLFILVFFLLYIFENSASRYTSDRELRSVRQACKFRSTAHLEISSMVSSVIHAWYGIPPIYVFPPSKFFDYWTCSSATLINQLFTRAFDGRRASGSGTPFVTVPKLAINQSMRMLMTEIDLNGSARIGNELL